MGRNGPIPLNQEAETAAEVVHRRTEAGTAALELPIEARIEGPDRDLGRCLDDLEFYGPFQRVRRPSHDAGDGNAPVLERISRRRGRLEDDLEPALMLGGRIPAENRMGRVDEFLGVHRG